MERYKLRVRVGNAEFEAEGPQDVVKDQFDMFMGCLASVPQATGGLNATPLESIRQRALYRHVQNPVVDPSADAANDDNREEQDTPPAGNADGTLSRLYVADPKSRSVSLKFLPNSKSAEVDSLLLLLYGFKSLTGDEHVSANELMTAARKSGLSLVRLDRILGSLNGFVQKGGKKRGTKYFLTNPGIAKAEALLREIESQMP